MDKEKISDKQIILNEYETNKDYYNTQYNYARQISNKLKTNHKYTHKILNIYSPNRKTLKKTKKPFSPFIKKAPKILLFDIENSPMLAYIWRCKTEYIPPECIKKPSAILTWAAKWLYDHEIHYGYVTPRQASIRTDKNIVKDLWTLIDEADILIAYNLKGFDRKVFNTRCWLNNINPPSSYKMVDPLLDIRKEFKLPSNKLDYVSQILLNNKKISTSMELWKRCVSNKKEEAEKAIQEMLTYNKHDLFLLEEIYLKVRPWIRSHPNVGNYFEDKNGRCPSCGSKDIKISKKYYWATTIKYKSIRCKSCGTAYGRKRYKTDKECMILPSR